MTGRELAVWALLSVILAGFVWIVGRNPSAAGLVAVLMAIYIIASRKRSTPWPVRLLLMLVFAAGAWLSTVLRRSGRQP